MGNLSWFQIAAIVYASLWVLKMYIVADDFSYIARIKVEQGTAKIQEGWSTAGYIRLSTFCYAIGAALSLVFLLIPTLYKEGFSFFLPYPRADLEHYVKHI